MVLIGGIWGASCLEDGDGLLFPQVTGSRRCTVINNKVHAWMRGIVGGDKQYRNWRQTISTLLEGAGVSRDRARHLVGHAPVDVHSRHYLKTRAPIWLGRSG